MRDKRNIHALKADRVHDHALTLVPGIYHMDLWGTGAQSGATYSVQLTHGNLFERQAELGVDMQFQAPRATVAPYAAQSQLIAGQLQVRNKGGVRRVLTLDSKTTHEGVISVLAKDTVSLDAGMSMSVPVEIRVRRDLASAGPIAVKFVAREGSATTHSRWYLNTPLDALPTHGQWHYRMHYWVVLMWRDYALALEWCNLRMPARCCKVFPRAQPFFAGK